MTIYTYEIIRTDLESGSIRIRFDADDPALSPRVLSLAVPFREDGSVDTDQLARAIASVAPISEWERERLAKANPDSLSSLAGLSGEVLPQAPEPEPTQAAPPADLAQASFDVQRQAFEEEFSGD